MKTLYLPSSAWTVTSLVYRPQDLELKSETEKGQDKGKFFQIADHLTMVLHLIPATSSLMRCKVYFIIR